MRSFVRGHAIGEGAKRSIRRALPESLYGRYRQRRTARQIARFQSYKATHNYGGFDLEVLIADPLAEAWYDGDWEEQTEIRELRNGRLVPGARVFDIGAHQGIVALVLSRIVGETGRVLAVEAEPHNARVAKSNADANGANNLEIVHAAISDQPGRVWFSEGLNGRVSEGTTVGKVEVPALTVDVMCDRYGVPDLVFLDVEGFEWRALAGASRTLARGDVDFFIEIHVGHGLEETGGTALGIVELLRYHGYEMRVSAARRANDDRPFMPIEEAEGLMTEHFFLNARTPGIVPFPR